MAIYKKSNKKALFIGLVLLLGIIDIYGQYDLSSVQDKDALVPCLVIGGGPAGCSAALIGSYNLIPTLMISNQPVVVGGDSIIGNWPGFYSITRKDLFAQLISQVKQQGTSILYDMVESVDLNQWPFVVQTKTHGALHALTLIIATGARKTHQTIPGEADYWGRGVALCSHCDAPRADKKSVLVYGDGPDVFYDAMKVALYADTVLIVMSNNQTVNDLDSVQQQRFFAFTNIDVMNGSVEQVIGDGRHVTAAVVRDLSTDTSHKKDVDMVFVTSKRKANTELFQGQLNMDDVGHIVTNGSQEVKEGVYVAGEAAGLSGKQAIVAAGAGAAAAMEAYHFFETRGFDANSFAAMRDQLYEPLKNSVRSSRVKHINSAAEFNRLLKAENGYFIVLFHAHGCGYCRQMMPIYESVAQNSVEFKDINFFTVEVTQVPDLMRQFSITGVPHLHIFKDGVSRANVEGGMLKDQFINFLKENIVEKKVQKSF